MFVHILRQNKFPEEEFIYSTAVHSVISWPSQTHRHPTTRIITLWTHGVEEFTEENRVESGKLPKTPI